MMRTKQNRRRAQPSPGPSWGGAGDDDWNNGPGGALPAKEEWGSAPAFPGFPLQPVFPVQPAFPPQPRICNCNGQGITPKKNVDNEDSHSDEEPKEPFDGIVERKEHYLIREQIWYKELQRWVPYDSSRYEISVPEQDLGTYFHVNIRHQLPGDDGELVLTDFSDTLLKFLRLSYGDEFYSEIPERSADRFLPDISIFQQKLAAIASHLSEESNDSKITDKHALAVSLGCQEAKKESYPESHLDRFLKDAHEHISVLTAYLLDLYQPKAEKLALQLADGCIEFDLLIFYFHINHRYYLYPEDMNSVTGFTLENRAYTYFDRRKSSLSLSGSAYAWNGYSYAKTPISFMISSYHGTRDIASLDCRPLTPEMEAALTARGRLYTSLVGCHYRSYRKDRIIVDTRRGSYPIPELNSEFSDFSEDLASLDRQPLTPEMEAPITARNRLYTGRHYRSHRKGHIIVDYRRGSDPQDDVRELKGAFLDFPEEDLCLLPGRVYGFNLTQKIWSTFPVLEIGPVVFDENAWDHLVLDPETKDLIKSLVQVTRNSNISSNIISDVITGKGGGLIAVLHGPTGTGKTLTAEAVADHLKRPLYIVGAAELSTTASALEERLKSILSLATAWDAVLLIDEADVFLEQRSLHEIERNSLVSVALRIFEYHRGVLFLTTNRIKTFDVAFLSRFSIAIKYPEHDLNSRRIIWRKFFELASVKTRDTEGSGRSTPTDMLDELAEKPFNGRTIKNLVRTAQALALSSGVPMSKTHVDVVVKSQEKFLREFATV
ncbi:P-loop containing nucleoside triphosphate hydrolase protein [Mycena albidolilacea]|uniref:P-loop containing nucleoside triphosphate hydrolase protein n=1 Tax=Mycena albidolilacea TaxID=1033008 RepID=A0AAD6ZUP9_9AGAR|nr:P-loop containing nucleoside triphosphate hydrolase protein [Mycena albidolilacea]